MSTDTYPEYFRRRPIGRAPSPPTWACYEQIPFDDDYSDSGSEDLSCSEDDEDYARVVHPPRGNDSDDSDAESAPVPERKQAVPAHGGDMEIDEGDEAMTADKIEAEYKKDVKGKQRAVEPVNEPESPKRRQHKKRREPVYTLRPILTIQRSQGFVWNQVRYLFHATICVCSAALKDLFVPPYIKDRCSSPLLFCA